MGGTKISELKERTLSESEVTQGSIFIPIQSGNSNNKILISNIYDQIKRAVMTEVNDVLSSFINGGGSGGSTPSSVPTQEAFNSLVNRVSYLETRFNDPTGWPTNYIGIKDTNTNNTIYYALPSGPGQSGIKKDEIIITQSNIQLPDMYFTADINTPLSEQDNKHKIIVTFTPSTKHDGFDLSGGTVHSLQVSGVIRTANGSSDILESVSLGNNGDGITFASGTTTFNPSNYQVAIVTSYDTTVNITNIEIKAKVGVTINDTTEYVEIPGAAMYYETSGGSKMTQPAAGYVTLPTNGS